MPGLEARRGYFMSVRPTFGTLMVNINTVHGAFYTSEVSGNLAQAMQNIGRQFGFVPAELFAKLRIFTRYRGYVKKHTIFRVLREPPSKITFYDNERKKKISVKEYFEDRKLTQLVSIQMLNRDHRIRAWQEDHRTPPQRERPQHPVHRRWHTRKAQLHPCRAVRSASGPTVQE